MRRFTLAITSAFTVAAFTLVATTPQPAAANPGAVIGAAVAIFSAEGAGDAIVAGAQSASDIYEAANSGNQVKVTFHQRENPQRLWVGHTARIPFEVTYAWGSMNLGWPLIGTDRVFLEIYGLVNGEVMYYKRVPEQGAYLERGASGTLQGELQIGALTYAGSGVSDTVEVWAALWQDETNTEMHKRGPYGPERQSASETSRYQAHHWWPGYGLGPETSGATQPANLDSIRGARSDSQTWLHWGLDLWEIDHAAMDIRTISGFYLEDVRNDNGVSKPFGETFAWQFLAKHDFYTDVALPLIRPHEYVEVDVEGFGPDPRWLWTGGPRKLTLDIRGQEVDSEAVNIFGSVVAQEEPSITYATALNVRARGTNFIEFERAGSRTRELQTSTYGWSAPFKLARGEHDRLVPAPYAVTSVKSGVAPGGTALRAGHDFATVTPTPTSTRTRTGDAGAAGAVGGGSAGGRGVVVAPGGNTPGATVSPTAAPARPPAPTAMPSPMPTPVAPPQEMTPTPGPTISTTPIALTPPVRGVVIGPIGLEPVEPTPTPGVPTTIVVPARPTLPGTIQLRIPTPTPKPGLRLPGATILE
jgi:hypothetical protein